MTTDMPEDYLLAGARFSLRHTELFRHDDRAWWVLMAHPAGQPWIGTPLRVTDRLAAGELTAARTWAQQRLREMGVQIAPWVDIQGPDGWVFVTYRSDAMCDLGDGY